MTTATPGAILPEEQMLDPNWDRVRARFSMTIGPPNPSGCARGLGWVLIHGPGRDTCTESVWMASRPPCAARWGVSSDASSSRGAWSRDRQLPQRRHRTSSRAPEPVGTALGLPRLRCSTALARQHPATVVRPLARAVSKLCDADLVALSDRRGDNGRPL